MEKNQNSSNKKVSLNKLEKISLVAGSTVAAFGIGYVCYGGINGDQEMINDGLRYLGASTLPFGLTLVTYLSKR